MARALLLVALLALTFSSANAWGQEGHQTVAAIALGNLTPAAKTKFNTILKTAQSQGIYTGINAAATWPDASRTAGGGTAGSHFIDFDDNPTAGQCTSAVVPDDCNGSASCVTTAIGQFAAQLAKSSPTSTDAVYALSLVIHYTGDSAQPLHASGYARGSNDVPAKFSGSSSKNMHSVWDTALPRARISKAGSQDAWTTKLSTLVTPAQAGTACIASASITSASDISACALKWAKESEALACSVVYGPKYTSTGDLSTGYATAAGPTVDQQVAKAGLRLSAILNKALGGK